MAIQYLHDLNINYNELQNAKLHVTSTTPTAVKGVIYFDDSSGVQKLKFHDGSGWKTIETESGDANKFVSGLSFNTTSGILTATMNDSSTVTVDLDGKYAESSHTHAFSELTSKPTTIDGYGITDAFDGAYGSLSGVPSTFTPASHTHAAADITSGTFATARIPNLAASKINSGTFDAARIPNISTDKLTSGTLPVGRGGTGATTLDAAGIVTKTGAQSIGGNKTFSNNVIVTGNLTVNGTTTAVNSNTVNIGDNILVLNSDETGTPSQSAGFEVERGTSQNARFIWDEGNDRFATELSVEGTFGPAPLLVSTLTATTLSVTNYGLSASDIPNLNTSKLTAGTLPVARGGTGATAFADKSVIVSQDSGTDALAAKAMTTNGSLLIGGSSGPEVATLTAGSNVTITNADGAITIASSISTSDVNTLIDARSSAHTITGNGSLTTFSISYGFTASAVNDVMIQVVDSSGDHDGDTVFAEVERVDTSRCSIKFATAPANSKTYRVLCFKIA